MNIFTNAVMKSSGKFEACQEDRLELIKEDWINWIEDCSAKKRKVPVGTASTRNIMRAAHKSEPCNSQEASNSRAIFESTTGPRETSNLGSVICNLEKDYFSSSEREGETDEYKQKNFVKRIVEAFEVKHKIHNDSKAVQETSKCPEENKSNAAAMLELWRRRSRILCNPFKNDCSYSKPNSRNADESDGDAVSSEGRIFHASWNSNSLIRRRLRELENSECSGKPKMIVSAFGRKASGLELCSTFLRSSSDSSSPSNCFTRAELMRKTNLSDLVKRFSPDKTKTMGSVSRYATSSEETIFSPDDSLPTTSTLIDDSLKSEHSSALTEISYIDESPKVVGAFLKKPIDVENTFIDWIPITGKRLPRKRSIKKLLCSLTSGKFIRRFSSERNLSVEPREFQDSGYDEKSCSSMSLTSLIPIVDVIQYQENNYFESNGRSDLKTFKSKNELSEEQSEASNDTYYSTENRKRKQLLLTEVPRENVKLDLGPSYPPLSEATKSLSPLIGELVPSRSNHPCVSKIPKDPSVTSTKTDDLAEFNSPRVYYNSDDSSSVIIKNDLYEVEFRRSCSDLPSSNVYGSASSVTSHYDVPRRFLSKSENEILWMWKSKSKSQLNEKEEPIYDVPRSQNIQRPRSSIYDEALSSKRKNIYVESKTNLNARSLARCDLQSHHAVTKPIDTRIYPKTQLQLSSLNRHLI